MGKTAILYHCHPVANGLDNLNVFLQNGYSSSHDYFISCCGFNPPEQQLSNLKFVTVDNDSFDFGGFSRLLANHIDVDKYDYFGFINSSARGPFFTPTSPGDWTDRFIDMLNEDTLACGSTINCLSFRSPYFNHLNGHLDPQKTYYHIQTYAYFLSKSAMNLLLDIGFYHYPSNWNKNETIMNYEIGLSQAILRHGFNIACAVDEYKGVDFRRNSEETRFLELIGDPCFPGAVAGRSIDPYEVLFVKPSRGFTEPL